MLRLGRITKVWHESRTADVLMIDGPGAQPLLRVPVLTATPDSWDIPDVEHSGDSTATGEREMFVAMAPLGINRWGIVGFLPGAKRPSMFGDGRSMVRNGAGVYSTTDKTGNMELYHPSGTFVRIGTPGHESLLGKDLDEQFAIPANTASTPTITIGLAAAGVSTGTITITPDGSITMTTAGAVEIETASTVTVTAGEDITVTTAGALAVETTAGVTVTAGEDVTVTTTGAVTVTAEEVAITAPTMTLTGVVNVVGDLNVTGGLGITGDATITGDISSDTISLQSHVHSDVTTGTSLSGTPYTGA